MDELHRVWAVGPGVLVVKGLVERSVVDQVTGVANAIQKKEPKKASPGSTRIFAFSQKHALESPESFAEYYGNDLL